MNYTELLEELTQLFAQDHPMEWYALRAVDGIRGGLYMWPATKAQPAPFAINRCARLQAKKLLFEFHVTMSDGARILLRAAWKPAPPAPANNPELINFLRWRDLAIELGAENVQEKGKPITSKSVAKWSDGPLASIRFGTPPIQAAAAINEFLKGDSDKAQALRDLVAHENFP